MQPLRRLGGSGRRGADVQRRCRELVTAADARGFGRDEVPVEAPRPDERVAAQAATAAVARSSAAARLKRQSCIIIARTASHSVLRRNAPYFLARRCRESSITYV